MEQPYITEGVLDLDKPSNSYVNPLNMPIPACPNNTSDAAHKAVEASLHSAELLRAQGDFIVAIAQSYKAECDALASDIETRVKKFEERIDRSSKYMDNAREVFKRESEKLELHFPRE